MKRIFSGIQPTGCPHLGNYLGAIRNWIRLQREPSCDRYYSIVDLHALTTAPAQLRRRTRDMAISLLASGVDPTRSVLFVQSAVPEHAQLSWLLSCLAPFGSLSRMTQWKSKSEKHQALLGLFSYPVLQAADILLYDATHVPVGHDQKQHLELCRDLAVLVNKRYGQELLTVPEAIYSPAMRIMSLRDAGKKMSKSEGDPMSRIEFTDTPDMIAKKIRKAVTDSQPGITYDLEHRPALKNLIDILAALTDKTPLAISEAYAPYTMSEFKRTVTDVLVEHLNPIQQRMRQLEVDSAYVDSILEQGQVRAQAVARQKYQTIVEVMCN